MGCLGEPGTVPQSGSVLFGSEGASVWARYDHALRWAIEMFCHRPGEKITKVVIEPISAAAGVFDNQLRRASLRPAAIIGACAYHRGIFKIERHKVADVRGLFIGRRNLKTDDAKAAVMRRCRQLGWDVADHNAADACALWAYECSLRRPAPIIHQLARCGL